MPITLKFAFRVRDPLPHTGLTPNAISCLSAMPKTSHRSISTERKIVIVRSSAKTSAIHLPDLRLRGANFGYRMDSRPVHLDEHERVSATRFARTGTNQRAIRSDAAIAICRG
jgi:hypothetical protein